VEEHAEKNRNKNRHDDAEEHGVNTSAHRSHVGMQLAHTVLEGPHAFINLLVTALKSRNPDL
jgi:hypothetical protein